MNLASSNFSASLQQDTEAWALRINASWRRSLETVIETGRLLIDAKVHLGKHGEWETLLQSKLDFSPSTAQRLMIIARDNRLTNPAHVQLLPRSYGTLYELTKLTDDEFALGLDKGIIGPDMERRDVDLIRPMQHRSESKSSDGGVEGHAYEPKGQVIPKANEASSESESGGGKKVLGAGIEPGPSEAIMPGGGLTIAHRRVEESDSLDFFPTPPWATRALFEHVLVHLDRRGHCKYQSVLEPACGEGHMAEVLKEYFPMLIASDISDYGKGYSVTDFLDPTTWTNSDWIITNPPFNRSIDFVERAIDLAGTGVAMFVRAAWLEGVERYERIFRDKPPTLIAFFTERVPLHKGRWEPDGATFTAYVWLTWIKGAEPRSPFWIPPGCRERLTKPDDVKRFGKVSIDGDAA